MFVKSTGSASIHDAQWSNRKTKHIFLHSGHTERQNTFLHCIQVEKSNEIFNFQINNFKIQDHGGSFRPNEVEK